MKQMITLTVVLVGLLILNSCDSVTTSFDTNLKTTISADIEDVNSGVKETTTYPFNATETLKIKDNSRINEYIDRLKEINVNSVTSTFTGIPVGETITELNISVESVALDLTLEDIDNGLSVELDVSHQLLNDISEELIDKHEITIYISGQSTFAPMELSILMDFAVTVTASVLE